MAEQDDKSKTNEDKATSSSSQAEASNSKDEPAASTPADAKLEGKAIGDMLKQLGLSDVTSIGKKQKDMDDYKFWKTQPVPNFGDVKKPIKATEEGPFKEVDIDKVPKQPSPLPEGFEWVTTDISDKNELDEVYNLLREHYVEDDDASFRFNYSPTFFNWALKAPGWKKEWHVGVRASKSQKLIAFISGVPIDLRIRKKTFRAGEVNFLCVHKKLREKRLAPVLIKEITRRINLDGIFQAIYTAGVVLPSPVSTCRYFHRTLDFEKLNEIKFSAVPPGSTVQRQVIKYRLPPNTAIQGLRPFEEKDIAQVKTLMNKYLKRFDMAQDFSNDDIDHWLLHKDGNNQPDQVVWTYVVEKNGKITDFVSFYRLESTVIKATVQRNKLLKAAYLYYYATDAAFDKDETALEKRLQALMRDALTLAKKNNFDVFNALTLMDNGLFLENQKFGVGDGKLHYYLFNYRAAPVAGGLDKNDDRLDPKSKSRMGMLML